MNKNKLLYGIMVSTFVVFINLLMACASAPVETGITSKVTDDFNIMRKDGKISQVNVIDKNFVTLGLIFVESSATIDSNGNIIKGSKITFEMLMKEAQKLGADSIVNILVDEIENITVTEEKRTIQGKDFWGGDTVREIKVPIERKTIIYKANALAIKYTP